MVEGLRGHRYDKPLAAMSAYLDGIKQVRVRRRTARGRVAALRTEDAGAEWL